ncbi:PVC-type heme-binding CxxCH protein [Rubinisphaera italica]|uniref:Cytochrome c n=1 Tax=Rubinisphaera italica TaxID=2527969 RepID=A0A5C5XF94_9PLAN|nr:PVC-type heme-binding CxxCH protein [Rubinisphaera italica]TWT61464.1 Cytochrome c [Rubinisphaera italica]
MPYLSARNLTFILPVCLCLTVLLAENHAQDNPVAGNKRVEEVFKSFGGKGVMSDGSDPTPPLESLKSFDVKEGMTVDLIAHEPEVSQPLFLTWDSRGRMWVLQYRQYQYPAGLKVVRFDQYLRAVFDKIPEPPPKGVKGLDKVTVHEDTDGDGIYDTSKDVITGLNIASSVQVGNGGIWVLNPPYLLFYPDANGDDIPDGDPEVHLSGFGIQDTHSISNSLLWGPDGWLYAANGSTTAGVVSSEVTKGVEFQGQCIWRYHPVTKVFEIYAEGGGNTFSLDIDSKGRVFSGTNGGNTRGYYYPQGSYADKNWGKHGPLTNPYAFGYFTHMGFEGDGRRFAQAFLIYEGGLFPQDYNGDIIAPNSLHNIVWHSERIPQGSTYRTVDHTNLLESSDRWFRPVYNGVGPDGSVYIADWSDTRLSHVSPVDDWHKESGRIYRVRPTDSSPNYQLGDLHQKTAEELITLLEHSNKWVRRRAMLELGWRADSSVVEQLIAKVNEKSSLESLWALNLMGELDSDLCQKWLQHPDEHIRRWVVRLIGDGTLKNIDSKVYEALAVVAANEPQVQVRSQLASTAKRIDAEFALPVVTQLLHHEQDLTDPHMPLMLWWAVEAHAEDFAEIEKTFSNPEVWSLELTQTAITTRLMQRYAAAGTPEDLQHCARLVEIAPDDKSRELLLIGLNKAFQGRTVPPLPVSLEKALADYLDSLGNDGIVLALRQGKPEAVPPAIKALKDTNSDLGLRMELARAFGEVKAPEVVSTLVSLATGRSTNEPAFQRVAIQSLANYDDPGIAANLIGSFQSRISAEHNLRTTACRTLASRKDWAMKLVDYVNSWQMKAEDVPADVIQQLRSYDDPELISAVEKAFGKPVEISKAEKAEEINRLLSMLAESAGDSAKGEVHFKKKCANCHKLFGQGETIGPPLDGYERGNPKFWLPAMVEPSLEIREGYQSYIAVTLDGRVITGMVAAQDPQTVTIRTADNRKIILAREDLEIFKAMEKSLMPEDVLKDLSDEDIRNLLAYLSQGARRK